LLDSTTFSRLDLQGSDLVNDLIRDTYREEKEINVFPVEETTQEMINLIEWREILIQIRDKWIYENER